MNSFKLIELSEKLEKECDKYYRKSILGATFGIIVTGILITVVKITLLPILLSLICTIILVYLTLKYSNMLDNSSRYEREAIRLWGNDAEEYW